MPIRLSASTPIALRGADALAFAQAQFAGDMRALAPGHWQWSAWLTAQGRVRAWFALLRTGESELRLMLKGGDAAAVVAELKRFVFRARVELAVCEHLAVFGAHDATDLAAFGFAAAPAQDTLAQHGEICALRLAGGRFLLSAPAATPAPNSAPALDAWRLADIRAGLPDLSDALKDQLLPHWLGLTRLGAVSVAKGCYPGQEVMARLHFKGGNKRGLAHVAFDADAVPAPGTALWSAGEAGLVLEAAGTAPGRIEALATLAFEAAQPRLGSEAGAAIEVVSRFD